MFRKPNQELLYQTMCSSAQWIKQIGLAESQGICSFQQFSLNITMNECGREGERE